MTPFPHFETSSPLLWLASYPRSGNTFLRTVMFRCFGVRSASLYPNDLGSDRTLHESVGHIEHSGPQKIDFGGERLWLVKTHDRPTDDAPAIYVVRNGRDATASLAAFDRVSMGEVVEGRHRFGTWANHLDMWQPRTRPKTLLLRYEDMTADLPATLARIADFTGLAPQRTTLPERDTLGDGRWIRTTSAERDELVGDALFRFWQINGEAMREYGYA